jgi:mRNA interferase RelE/StbE
MKIAWSKKSLKQLQKLEATVATRIIKKMTWFCNQSSPLSFAEHLTNHHYGTHRFRIGDYRVICVYNTNEEEIIIVVSTKHRKDVYK